MNSDVQKRSEVAVLMKQDWAAAMELARTIETPWYRCQALAYLAKNAEDQSEKDSALREAFTVALFHEQPNRVVSVSAWPLRALVESGQAEHTDAEVERLLGIIATEPSPVRRADALELMMGAVVAAPRTIFDRVFQAFLSACLSPLSGGRRNRRGQSQLYGALDIIAVVDFPLAREVGGHITGPELSERVRSLFELWEADPPTRENIYPRL